MNKVTFSNEIDSLDWSDDEQGPKGLRLTKKDIKALREESLPSFKVNSSFQGPTRSSIISNTKLTQRIHSNLEIIPDNERKSVRKVKLFDGSLKQSNIHLRNKPSNQNQNVSQSLSLKSLGLPSNIPSYLLHGSLGQLMLTLWEEFLDIGGDKHGMIEIKRLKSLQKRMNKLGHCDLPYENLSFTNLDSDDYVSFADVVNVLLKDRVPSGQAAQPKYPCPPCCGRKACQQHLLCQSSRNSKSDIDIQNHDTFLLYSMYERHLLRCNSRLRINEIPNVLSIENIPHDKSRIELKNWYLYGEFIIESFQEFEKIVNTLRIVDQTSDLKDEQSIYQVLPWQAEILSPAEILLYRHHFTMVDKNKTNQIKAIELVDLFKAVGATLSIKQAEKFITAADDNGSNSIDFTEFLTLVCKIQRNAMRLEDKSLLKAFHSLKRELRIFHDIEAYMKNPFDDVSIHRYGGSPFTLDAIIRGPKSSMYEGHSYHLSVAFKDPYPYKVPDVVFVTRIYCVNVMSTLTGQGLLQHLKYIWTSDWTLTKLFQHILGLLLTPDLNLLPVEMSEIVELKLEILKQQEALAQKLLEKHEKESTRNISMQEEIIESNDKNEKPVNSKSHLNLRIITDPQIEKLTTKMNSEAASSYISSSESSAQMKSPLEYTSPSLSNGIAKLSPFSPLSSQSKADLPTGRTMSEIASKSRWTRSVRRVGDNYSRHDEDGWTIVTESDEGREEVLFSPAAITPGSIRTPSSHSKIKGFSHHSNRFESNVFSPTTTILPSSFEQSNEDGSDSERTMDQKSRPDSQVFSSTSGIPSSGRNSEGNSTTLAHSEELISPTFSCNLPSPSTLFSQRESNDRESVDIRSENCSKSSESTVFDDRNSIATEHSNIRDITPQCYSPRNSSPSSCSETKTQATRIELLSQTSLPSIRSSLNAQMHDNKSEYSRSANSCYSPSASDNNVHSPSEYTNASQASSRFTLISRSLPPSEFSINNNCQSEYSKSNYSKSEYTSSEFSESECTKSEYTKTEYSKSSYSMSEYSKSNISKSAYTNSEYTPTSYSRSNISQSNYTESAYTGYSESYYTKTVYSPSIYTKTDYSPSRNSTSEYSSSRSSYSTTNYSKSIFSPSEKTKSDYSKYESESAEPSKSEYSLSYYTDESSRETSNTTNSQSEKLAKIQSKGDNTKSDRIRRFSAANETRPNETGTQALDSELVPILVVPKPAENMNKNTEEDTVMAANNATVKALMRTLSSIEQMHVNVLYTYMLDKEKFKSAVDYYAKKNPFVLTQAL